MRAAKGSFRKKGIRRVFSREGYFGRRAADHRAVFLWSAVLALMCTLISYPGIWYSDSYVRVSTGGAILNSVVKTLIGQRAPLNTGNAFTPAPSFFMALSIGLTGHVGLYTFGQAFAFFAATFLLIRELNPGSGKLQSVLFALCPLIYGMSVYYEAGIGCVTGIAALILLFRRIGDPKPRGDRVLEFLMICFFSYVTFGYRTNALTILPVLGYMLLRIKTGKSARTLAALALAAGIVLTKGIPWIFDVRSQSTASVGIVWEMLTAIQRMPAEEQEKYRDYLDEIGGEGSTRTALQVSEEGTAGSFMWGEALGTDSLSAPGATAGAVKKYIQLLTERPGEWGSVKRDVILRSMGLPEPLDYSEYNYDRWDAMKEFGMVDSVQRRAFYDSFMETCGGLGWMTLHPWTAFLATLIMMIAAMIGKMPRRGLYGTVACMAAFYYLAYLLDTPAYDFRYYYPSLYLMMITDAAMMLEWLRAGLRKAGAGRRKEGNPRAAAGRHSGVQ